MNSNDTQEFGYLTVRVSTARGAIPLAGAVVNVRDGEDSATVLYSLISDGDGKTEKVALRTPPAENSDFPEGATAYALYNVDVFKEGYIPLYFHNVPIFPSVISVQPAVMIPEAGGVTSGMGNVTETPPSDIERGEI